jgi:hypothetical protein
MLKLKNERLNWSLPHLLHEKRTEFVTVIRKSESKILNPKISISILFSPNNTSITM